MGATAQALPTVQKVEPPSWWAAHTINPVRLLVRGANLEGAHVTATRPGTSASAVAVNSAGTYLFVSVNINPAAQPGDYPLQLETASGKTTIPFRLNAPLDAATNFQGITNDDVVYLIMPDRFSDGDTSNNAPAGSPPEANDRKNPRAYHGGDLRGIIKHLSYLKELGVTAIWLNPWYENWHGVTTCDKPWCPNTSYHGYGATDYYNVEQHFGDLGDLRELVRQAHAQGIKVIQDQVANHVGSHHPWLSDSPLDDWFHGTTASHLKNPFRADLLLSPNAATAERKPTLDGWFDDSLPDINQEEPEVARYEIQNSLWWIGVTGIDGIRQDTIQYMPRFFIRDLSSALHRQYPKMWMVGEVFDHDSVQTSFFIGGHTGWDHVDTELDSVFDFPLWRRSLDVFTNKKPVRTLRDLLKYDGLYPEASRLTTMLNNHDVRRTISIEGMTMEGAMLHTAFLLSVRGIPQLYYADEIALAGGEDPDNRRDFPGGFPGDHRNAFTKGGRTPEEQRMLAWTRDWIRLRREHPAIRRGQTIDLVYDDDIYVFARRNMDETVIIVVNRAATPKKTTIPGALLETADGSQLLPLLVAKDRVRALDGAFTFDAPPRTAVAYKLISPE
ncbi:MAG TPA: alpha-amylase family glycosyl hydrolase [Pyrinomonadaceae bacterium]|nr:alpha-amylase family glycosyl hydrolase [Pyrinomonadaceae bacterium]